MNLRIIIIFGLIVCAANIALDRYFDSKRTAEKAELNEDWLTRLSAVERDR